MQWRSFGLATLMLSLTLITIFKINARGVPVVLHTNIENLPMQIAKYQGQTDSFSQGVYDELQADQHVYRHYDSPQGDQIDLYIGYYGTAKGGRTGHNPYGCLPGAGWGFVENTTIFLKPSYNSRGVQLNLVVARKADQYNVMLHWYQSAGTQVLSTGIEQNLQRFKGRLLHNRNDGAYLQISSLAKEQDVFLAKERLAGFALEVLELLPQYWPEEGILNY